MTAATRSLSVHMVISYNLYFLLRWRCTNQLNHFFRSLSSLLIVHLYCSNSASVVQVSPSSLAALRFLVAQKLPLFLVVTESQPWSAAVPPYHSSSCSLGTFSGYINMYFNISSSSLHILLSALFTWLIVSWHNKERWFRYNGIPIMLRKPI